MQNLQLIIGHVTGSTARIWVRGVDAQRSATVSLSKSTGELFDSKQVVLINEAADVYTAVVDFKDLTPDTDYNCLVNFNTGAPVHGKVRTFPLQAEEFTFMISSCNLFMNAETNRIVFEQLKAIAEFEGARFMIHAGDQAYIDKATENVMYTVDDYAARYLQNWDNPSAAAFFSTLPHYMTLDDHELVNNFANDYHYQNGCTASLYRRRGLKAYQVFQHSHNPTPERTGTWYYTFRAANICFFVMDIRTERWINEKEMISEDQMNDLFEWLDKYKNEMKFIVSAVPFITSVKSGNPLYGHDDKWCSGDFKGQRDKILKRLFNGERQKLVFLSGDVHSAISTSIEKEEKRFHELIAGPLNQHIYNAEYMFDKSPQQKVGDLNCNFSVHKKVGENKLVEYSAQGLLSLTSNSTNPYVTRFANVLIVKVSANTVRYGWRSVQSGPGTGNVLESGEIDFSA